MFRRQRLISRVERLLQASHKPTVIIRDYGTIDDGKAWIQVHVSQEEMSPFLNLFQTLTSDLKLDVGGRPDFTERTWKQFVANLMLLSKTSGVAAKALKQGMQSLLQATGEIDKHVDTVLRWSTSLDVNRDGFWGLIAFNKVPSASLAKLIPTLEARFEVVQR